jgi:non-ribosomal peptide synthetase component F
MEVGLSQSMRNDVRMAARRLKSTPYVLLVAAYFRLVSELTGRDDMVIVTPLAGRTHPQVAPIIGDFINLVPMRISNLFNLSVKELLVMVKDQIAAVSINQDYQFDELLDDLKLPFNPDRNPLTGFSLNFMPQGGVGEIAEGRHTDRGYRLKYDILFLIRDFTNVTNIEIQCRAGLLTSFEIETLFGNYCHHLKELSNV